MAYERTEIQKVKGSKITEPFYPDDKRCIYCQGDYPVDAVLFRVELKNGIIISPVCDVCIYENIFADCKMIKTITNIGDAE